MYRIYIYNSPNIAAFLKSTAIKYGTLPVHILQNLLLKDKTKPSLSNVRKLGLHLIEMPACQGRDFGFSPSTYLYGEMYLTDAERTTIRTSLVAIKSAGTSIMIKRAISLRFPLKLGIN